MKLRERYIELSEMLLPHQGIWKRSILQHWPESRQSFPDEWLEATMALSPGQQAALDDERWEGPCPASLRVLLDSIDRLSDLPLHTQAASIKTRWAQGMNQKKRHELERLLPFLSSIIRQHDIRHAVDIGGGVGHLARLCTHEFGLAFHSIDQDAVLQGRGADFVKKQRDFPAERLHFVNARFSAEADPQVDPLFQSEATLSIGLHTCGPLALHQFQKSAGSRATLNFACCYDRLDTETQVNLSKTAREKPIPWTTHSLFLATRGRKGKTAAEFALMQRVNFFRFAADALIKDFYPELGFVRMGDAPRLLYEGPFSLYIEDRLARLSLPCPLKASELDAFYEKENTHQEVQAIFAAHLLRSLFARPLELCLLMDRVLWLEDHGHKACLAQFFDREISPRNLGIFARPFPAQ